MQYPKCFDDFAQFRAWRQSAMIAKESVSPCADCSAAYQERIGERCDRKTVQQNFRVYDTRTQENENDQATQ